MHHSRCRVSKCVKSIPNVQNEIHFFMFVFGFLLHQENKIDLHRSIGTPQHRTSKLHQNNLFGTGNLPYSKVCSETEANLLKC